MTLRGGEAIILEYGWKRAFLGYFHKKRKLEERFGKIFEHVLQHFSLDCSRTCRPMLAILVMQMLKTLMARWIFRSCVWVVKASPTESPARSLEESYENSFQSNFPPKDPKDPKAENSLCTSALHRFYSIKPCKSKVLWVKLQLCRALLHQQICVLRGVL